MEGYFEIWQGYKWLGWKRQYFVFYNDVLAIQDTKKGPRLGAFHLKVSKITINEYVANQISLFNGMNYFYFRFKTEEKRDSWF